MAIPCAEDNCCEPAVSAGYCSEHTNHTFRGSTREFESGASRDTESGKLDYEAFLSPIVLKRYAEFMHKNRKLADGTLRDGDNWQRGIPQNVYIKSLLRHFMDLWMCHRHGTPGDIEEVLCAILFNTFGYLFEELKDG